MKKLPLIIILMLVLLVAGTSAQTTRRRFSIAVGAGRSAPLTAKTFDRRQFNTSVIFSYKLTNRLNFNLSLVENFGFRTPNLRSGISFRIY